MAEVRSCASTAIRRWRTIPLHPCTKRISASTSRNRLTFPQAWWIFVHFNQAKRKKYSVNAQRQALQRYSSTASILPCCNRKANFFGDSQRPPSHFSLLGARV